MVYGDKIVNEGRAELNLHPLCPHFYSFLFNLALDCIVGFMFCYTVSIIDLDKWMGCCI